MIKKELKKLGYSEDQTKEVTDLFDKAYYAKSKFNHQIQILVC